ncbi:MAG: sulfatase-like hydrolase/transferase [Acidobacteria bacterium]|nr:sulfatase-like hydrolase/transferase [Acidobacteriota bacterium]MBV9478950.1 sulfatase-like hydrolase/transferase [Acidobacteriota bacterium]
MRRPFLALLLLALVACRRETPPPRRPPVILISIDTLRSDHLPAYGYRAIATPNLDRLAHDGVVFERAFSNVPLTLPSHTTIMTGLLPAEHGVRDNAGYRLDPSHATLASLLHANGYATAAAVSAYTLRRDSNIAAGFDSYDDRIDFVEGAPTGNLQRDGAATSAILKTWIAAHDAKPFFAFLHLFEPHAPYEPSYDGEIEKADRIVGDFLDDLRARKLYDDALIVLLSDHGEGLGDHGEQEHGVLLYREALQVPLIVKLPRGARGGERVTEPAQLADVFPTIASVIGITPPHVRGRSLLDPGSPRALYAETLYPRIHLGWSELQSIVRYPLHLIDGPKPELYDVASDPRETNDLRATRRRDYAELARDLASFPHAAAAAPAIDPEERRKLAALGYVDAGSSAGASRINPREHLADLAELKSVSELMTRRDYAAAAQRLEALLARNPGWSDLRNDLGFAYEQLGDLARADKTYRDGIRATPELAGDFALSLASVLAREGKLDDAAAHAKLALASNAPGAHEVLARIALTRKQYDEALREAAAMRASPAHQIHAEVLTAQILAAQGHHDAALTALQHARERASADRVPLPPRYWFITGDTLASLGRTNEARTAFERAIAAEPTEPDAYVGLAFVEAASGNRGAADAALFRMTNAIPRSRNEAEQIRHELEQH